MPDRENGSTEKEAYFTDPESAAEMARLIKQARLLTKAMGGLLDESINPSKLFDILDLACGPPDPFKRRNIFFGGNILDSKYELQQASHTKPNWSVWSDQELQNLAASEEVGVPTSFPVRR